MGLRALLALVLPLLAAIAGLSAPAEPSSGASAAGVPRSQAEPAVVRRCRTVRVKLKRRGRVVKRKGKPVFRRVRRCRKVPSPGCHFVKRKKRRNGKVVKRKGKPVYIKVERCPPKPDPGPKPNPGPGPGPAPGPGPGPGPSPGGAQILANRVLALAQHTPHDVGLFTSVFERDPQPDADGVYPLGPAMAPATGPPPDEDAVRARLTAYLNRYFGADTSSIAAALALFDDADLKAKCDGGDDEDATLRAAIAATKGTVYEPAIEYGLAGDNFQQIGYTTLANSTFIAGSTGGDTNRFVFVNELYRNESFEYLIGIMGHEFMHHDVGTPRAEEAILNSLSAMGHMQVLSAAPELAHGGSELARNVNDLALGFVNSREAGSPDSEIYAPTGLGAFPGSPHDATDMWTLFQGNSTTGVAPAQLRTILLGVMEPGTTIPATPDYSQATAELFEHLGDTWLTDVERAQLSVLLELVTVQEIATATGLGQQQIIDTLGLQPYLDAIP
jgi:hypothetical protein